MSFLVIEPYCGGSHARFIADLQRRLPYEFVVMQLPARKWKWRLRASAAWFAAEAARLPRRAYRGLLCSTFLDLAVFRGLAPPAIAALPAIVYWHENQFAYPVRSADERDFAFLMANVHTAVAADRNVFDSRFNLESMIAGARQFLAGAPDMAFPDFEDRLRACAVVLPTPIDLEFEPPGPRRPGPRPCILWNHRFEHDKNPETFFRVLEGLADEGLEFDVAVSGQNFRDAPAVFALARERFKDRTVFFGEPDTRAQYLDLLDRADVVVSTAWNEFQGLAMLEAALHGAHPLAPRRVVYPEIYPERCLYDDDAALRAKLHRLITLRPAPDEDLIEHLQEWTWARREADFRALFDDLRALPGRGLGQ